MSTDLVAWLRAQLDEDERVAPEVHLDGYDMNACAEGDFSPCDCGWPARILAEVAAKRRIVDYFADDAALASPVPQGVSRDGWLLRLSAARFTIKALALPYAGRPGFREEWRP